MATTMHRLQISLPPWEMQYLEERARREGRSIADVVRQLVQQDAETRSSAQVESIWEIAGIGDERAPLIEGIPVSERPELYIGAATLKPKASKRVARRRTRARGPSKR